ncbi:hypothetical protein A7U60_g5485 [Sanghuangporus baumii]|uniref:Transcriptional activator HAP2 n=1 Tax=Sanghuangporus baumii TaxID=108892 RepID=A0A9Q5N7Y9_SANBA|nr:hypothetical protein A7U60_g5485 [Sanghuangporus baumii]
MLPYSEVKERMLSSSANRFECLPEPIMEGHRNVVDQLFTAYHLHQLNQYHQDHSPSPTQQQQQHQPQHSQQHPHPSLGDIHLSQIQHGQHDIYAHQRAQQGQGQQLATHQQQIYHGHPHLAHQHAQQLHRPPSRTLSPQVSERDSGTPIGEDDYLIARHQHVHGHQHQPQHSHLHHELDLEMTDATIQQPQAGPSSSGLTEPPATAGAAVTTVSDQPLDEEPLYVNAKQYYRILKRRVARARLEELHRLSRQRKRQYTGYKGFIGKLGCSHARFVSQEYTSLLAGASPAHALFPLNPAAYPAQIFSLSGRSTPRNYSVYRLGTCLLMMSQMSLVAFS